MLIKSIWALDPSFGSSEYWFECHLYFSGVWVMSERFLHQPIQSPLRVPAGFVGQQADQWLSWGKESSHWLATFWLTDKLMVGGADGSRWWFQCSVCWSEGEAEVKLAFTEPNQNEKSSEWCACSSINQVHPIQSQCHLLATVYMVLKCKPLISL